jgi:SAM-dependent methyltransferase
MDTAKYFSGHRIGVAMIASITSDRTSGTLKHDWRALARFYEDPRSAEQLQEHYLLERRLADRLRYAPAEERLALYGPVYDELFSNLPHHPQFTRRRDDLAYARKQIAVLKRVVPRDADFLEIGAGDCRVSIELALDWCRRTTAVDVSDKVMAPGPYPSTFKFVRTTGMSFDIKSSSIDFAYSNQLMEHLHPDDAVRQLGEIRRVLRPGGLYFCITPSRLTGPHDVSRYFDRVARGFHLVEYDYSSVARTLKAAGFSGLRACITRGGHFAGALPVAAAIAYERAFATLPRIAQSRLTRQRVVRAMLGVAVLARKPR